MKRRKSNFSQALDAFLTKAEDNLSEEKKKKLKAKVENNARAMRNKELKKKEQKMLPKPMIEQAFPTLPKKNRNFKTGSKKIISSGFESNRRKH
jgi:hypothetical protein